MYVKLLLNQQVRDHLNLQRGLLVLVFFLLSAIGVQAQTVTSDKDDYAPGEVAIISGTGWTGDNHVDVHFEETPAYHAEHQHDYHGIAVDANGNWTIKYQIEDRHLGVAFDVHVIGKQSGAHAHTYFTDAAVEFKASGLPNPTNVTVSSISYTISKKQGNIINYSTFNDTDKPFNAPNGSATTTHSAVEHYKVYFTYPRKITGSDGLIYSLGDNDVTATYTVTTGNSKGVYNVTTLSYDGKNIWSLDALPHVITVTAAYKLSTSPTTLSVSAASGTYGGTTTLTATLKSGTTNLSGKTVNFSVNGVAAGSATTDANGVAAKTDVSIAGINASTTAYADYITASYAGETSVYVASSGKNSLTIGKAATTTVVTLAEGPFTYTGSAIKPATVSVTGAGGLNLTPTADYADNVNAGTATASYSYAETANHLASTDSKTFTIGKAAQVITWNIPAAITYGTLLSSTQLNASVTGVVGGSATGAITYNPSSGTLLLPGIQTLRVDISETINYNAAFKEVNLDVNCVVVNASESSTPQAVKSTTTEIKIKVTTTTGVNAVGVPVTLYFNNRVPMNTLSDLNGIATFNVGVLPVDVYRIEAVVEACSARDVAYLPVYDPNGGFVTGGGWITSPIDTRYQYMDKTGKANFGFIAKYKKGTTQVDGNTEFQFQAGNLNFKSSSHDEMSLIISGHKVSYKGKGSINGVTGFSFMVSGVDGDLKTIKESDKFRIKIWNASGVVYDNQGSSEENAEAATAIGGGSIVIHENKSTGGSTKTNGVVAETSLDKTELYNYPNTFSNRTTIAFRMHKSESYALEVYDLRGVLVKKIDLGVAEAGKLYEYEFNGTNQAEGMYIARLVTSSGMQSVKMILRK